MLDERDSLQTARVIRAIDIGSSMQLLCADDRGILSVYFDHGQFEVFLNCLRKVNLNLDGLLIQFDRDLVLVPQCGKSFNRQPARRKARFA